MKRLLALSLILALPGCWAAPSVAEDEAAARDAVLAMFAEGERRALINQAGDKSVPPGRNCVARRTEASPTRFEIARPDIHPGAEWTLMGDAEGNGRTIVDPALTRAANAARRAVRPARALMAPGESLPPPLRPDEPGQHCRSVAALSALSIQGDFAFVEIVNFCGDDCAGAALYALRRERGEWRAYADLSLWVT